MISYPSDTLHHQSEQRLEDLEERQRIPPIRGSVLAFLSISGILLVIGSSLTYDIEWLPVLELGLFRLLPITYWLGLGLLVFSLALGFRSGKESLFLFQVVLLYIAIWGAASLFLRYPDSWDSFMHYYSSLQIADEGSVLAQGIFSYSANYPGFFIVGSAFSMLANPDVVLFLRLYPLFVSSLTLVTIYLFVRTYLPGWDHRFALLVSCFGNVWVQFNFSPQSLGLVAGLLVFVFLEKEGFRWLMMALAAFVYLVMSHPTTSLFVVAGLVVREVILLLSRWRAKDALKERPWPILAFLLVWAGWLFTGAREYSNFLWDIIYSKLAFIFELPEATSQQIGQRTVGNIFFLGPYLRLALLGTLGLFLVLAALHWLRSRRRRPIPGSLLAMSFVPIVVIPLDIFIFMGQLYDRGFLFFALATPILVTLMYFRRWSGWKKVVALLLILATVVCCSSTFYQESLYVISNRSLEMSEFVDEHVPSGSLVIGGTYPDITWRDSNWTTFTRIKIWAVHPDPFNNITRDRGAAVMIFDRSSELWQTQWGFLYKYEFYQDNMTLSSKVYESGAYQVIYGGTVRR